MVHVRKCHQTIFDISLHGDWPAVQPGFKMYLSSTALSFSFFYTHTHTGCPRILPSVDLNYITAYNTYNRLADAATCDAFHVEML